MFDFSRFTIQAICDMKFVFRSNCNLFWLAPTLCIACLLIGGEGFAESCINMPVLSMDRASIYSFYNLTEYAQSPSAIEQEVTVKSDDFRQSKSDDKDKFICSAVAPMEYPYNSQPKKEKSDLNDWTLSNIIGAAQVLAMLLLAPLIGFVLKRSLQSDLVKKTKDIELQKMRFIQQNTALDLFDMSHLRLREKCIQILQYAGSPGSEGAIGICKEMSDCLNEYVSTLNHVKANLPTLVADNAQKLNTYADEATNAFVKNTNNTPYIDELRHSLKESLFNLRESIYQSRSNVYETQ